MRDAAFWDGLLRRRLIVIAYVVVLMIGFMASLTLDPAGFDRCEAVPSESQVRAQGRVESVAASMAIPALVLLVVGQRRERRRGKGSLPKFAVAVVIVLALGSVAGLRASSAFERHTAEVAC